jgi:alkyl hydroperoxide reductase subunit AhpC
MNENLTPIQLVGNKAPDFTTDAVVNGEFKQISLKDIKGWKVLFFYPLDFTFVCPTEITAFSDSSDKFKEIDCTILGCSVDSKYSHLAWSKMARNEGGLGQLKYPLLTDLDKSIARKYGVLMNESIALRGTFIIDSNNVVQHTSINNLGVGRNIEETLRLVKAFQFNQKNGEVCPANWNSGSDSMKPDPQGSKEWFKKNQK